MNLIVELEGGYLSREGWPRHLGGRRHGRYKDLDLNEFQPQVNQGVQQLLEVNQLAYEPTALFVTSQRKDDDYEYQLRQRYRWLDSNTCLWFFRAADFATPRRNMLDVFLREQPDNGWVIVCDSNQQPEYARLLQERGVDYNTASYASFSILKQDF